MNDLQELSLEMLGHVAGGDGITVVVGGNGGGYADNGSSCSPLGEGPGNPGGATKALNAHLGTRA